MKTAIDLNQIQKIKEEIKSDVRPEEGWERFFNSSIAFSVLFFSLPLWLDPRSTKEWILLFASPLLGLIFLHAYADHTGLRNRNPYCAAERMLMRVMRYLYLKIIEPTLHILGKLLKIGMWIAGIGIVIGLCSMFFGAIASMSVTTLLAIIIVLLILK